MNERQYTSRGFRAFLATADDHGHGIRVAQSSEIGEPRVWVFVDDPGEHPAAYLTVEQAEAVANALLDFVREARDGTLP